MTNFERPDKIHPPVRCEDIWDPQPSFYVSLVIIVKKLSINDIKEYYSRKVTDRSGDYRRNCLKERKEAGRLSNLKGKNKQCREDGAKKRNLE